MKSMNPNWMRWIHASLRTYITDALEGSGVVVFFEGESRDVLRHDEDWIEFRWTGPDATVGPPNYWHLSCMLNIVVSSTTNREDTYAHQVTVGKVHAILGVSIPVYKYGNGTDDDQSLLGCLQLRADEKDPIMTNYFGRMQEVELEQSTIEAYYCLSGNF